MDKRGWLLACCLCLGPCLPACEPEELPAFANPPPDDAGTDAGDSEDAGSMASRTRIVEAADAAAH
jgi:hypothetical protein